MINITYGEAVGFIEKTYNELEALEVINNLDHEHNLFIDGELIEDTSVITTDRLNKASFIIIHEKITGA